MTAAAGAWPRCRVSQREGEGFCLWLSLRTLEEGGVGLLGGLFRRLLRKPQDEGYSLGPGKRQTEHTLSVGLSVPL